VVITGLNAGTNYNQIKIRAVNVNGKGTGSSTLSGTPLVAVPSAPSNLSVTPGDGQLKISFTPADANGSTILRYEYSLDGGITFTQFSTNYITTPVIISGLTNRALYTSIKIRAVSTIGNGAASATVSGTPSRAAAAPTILSVTPGDKALVVAFTPGNDFGSSISNYEYSLDGGISWKALSPVDGTTPITISGLTNGVVYSALRIRAVNIIGSGDRSELFSGTPAAAATAPAAPLIISLLPGNGKISLTLSPTVSNGGSPLSRYEYSLNNGSTWSNLALPVSGNVVEIINLINGTSYSQVRLRSVNLVGTSSSTSVPSFTPNP
jgi:titin